MALDDAGRRADVLRRMGFGAVVALSPDEARATVGCDRAWERDMEAAWAEARRQRPEPLPVRAVPAVATDDGPLLTRAQHADAGGAR